MRQRAALVWDTYVDLVEYDSGLLLNLDSPGNVLTFKELAAELNKTGGPVAGRGNLSPQGVGDSATATILDVEVDPGTGKVSVVRATAFQDAGRAIHPGYVEGQIQGGTAQGIGWVLNEEYVMFEDGVLLNTSFLDYRLPTSLDLPMIDAVIIEVPDPVIRTVCGVSAKRPSSRRWPPWPTLSTRPPAKGSAACPFPPAGCWKL